MKFDQALTLPQAAQKAKMSGDRLRRRLLTGEIAGELIAGRWLVDPTSLADFLRQGDTQPVPAA